jgi:hypothetical protein
VENCAIGTDSDVLLYSVKEEFWPRAQPPYAAGWPEYRAPTGVSSTSREHVLRWVRNYIADIDDPNLAIVEKTVACKSLADALRSSAMSPQIDVLQVDAEGQDDRVIYASAIEETRPAIIYYERASLKDSRGARLSRFLREAGYVEIPAANRGNNIAVRIG